ncbi:MAG: hypothetical protein AAFZ91_12890 [Pseudomonadota bacterium]
MVLPAQAESHACEPELLSAEALMQWPAWGVGQRMLLPDQVLVEESEQSKGYMMVSPTSIADHFTLSFETLILSPATVLVVGLIGSSATGAALFADDYDANLPELTRGRPFMMIPFHNAAHNRPGAFIATFDDGQRRILDQAYDFVTRVDTVHQIEFGKDETQVWLDIDGERLVSAPVEEVPQNTHLMLRLRGTGFREAAALFRNVELNQCDH